MVLKYSGYSYDEHDEHQTDRTRMIRLSQSLVREMKGSPSKKT